MTKLTVTKRIKTPADIIREKILDKSDELTIHGITVKSGVATSQFYRIMNGETRMTPHVAVKISNTFEEVTADELLKAQSDFDLLKERKNINE